MMSFHPIVFLHRWLQRDHPDSVLEFSRYVYKHYGRTESREIVHYNCGELNLRWLEDEIAGLQGWQELALHSRVQLPTGQVCHIPMIDFMNVLSPEIAANRTKYVTSFLGVPLDLYRSGNSLHGYYHTLIPQEKWLDFLGSLLLCNLPERIAEDVIDARWVGHSLKHRFCALRWSKHTDTYKEIPSRVITEFSQSEQANNFVS